LVEEKQEDSKFDGMSRFGVSGSRKVLADPEIANLLGSATAGTPDRVTLAGPASHKTVGDRDITGYGTGSAQLVGGEGAATRLRDEEEESQETDLDHPVPFPWTDEEIDWFIDAEEGLGGSVRAGFNLSAVGCETNGAGARSDAMDSNGRGGTAPRTRVWGRTISLDGPDVDWFIDAEDSLVHCPRPPRMMITVNTVARGRIQARSFDFSNCDMYVAAMIATEPAPEMPIGSG
jgi:hypothetical protein